jgi:hypothetical protein
LIFKNAVPGEIGNINGTGLVTGPGTWSLDLAMSKSIEFMEGKRLEFRMDARNIFNHASPSFGGTNPVYQGAREVGVANPNALLNDMWANWYPFGYLDGKAGHRTFQARLRLSF